MDHLSWHRVDAFEYHVVVPATILERTLFIRQVKLHNPEQCRPHFLLEWLLAQLALQQAPKVARDSLAHVDLPLAVQPLTQAHLVNGAHTACTIARTQHRVVCLFFAKADATD